MGESPTPSVMRRVVGVLAVWALGVVVCAAVAYAVLNALEPAPLDPALAGTTTSAPGADTSGPPEPGTSTSPGPDPVNAPLPVGSCTALSEISADIDDSVLEEVVECTQPHTAEVFAHLPDTSTEGTLELCADIARSFGASPDADREYAIAGTPHPDGVLLCVLVTAEVTGSAVVSGFASLVST